MRWIVDFFYGIIDNLYKTLVYQDRYLFIIKGLFNTLIIALFAIVLQARRQWGGLARFVCKSSVAVLFIHQLNIEYTVNSVVTRLVRCMGEGGQ